MDRTDLIHYLDDLEYKKLEREEALINKYNMYSSPQITGLPSGTTKIYDKEAERLAKIVEKFDKEIDKINDDIEELVNKRYMLKDIIEHIDKPFYKSILIDRYLIGKELNEIADEFKKEEKYIRTLHGYALNEFDNICKKI